jgi:hypothetical protein
MKIGEQTSWLMKLPARRIRNNLGCVSYTVALIICSIRDARKPSRLL